MCMRLLQRLFRPCRKSSKDVPVSARMSVPEEVRDKDHELRNRLMRAHAINREARRELFAIEELVNQIRSERGELG